MTALITIQEIRYYKDRIGFPGFKQSKRQKIKSDKSIKAFNINRYKQYIKTVIVKSLEERPIPIIHTKAQMITQIQYMDRSSVSSSSSISSKQHQEQIREQQQKINNPNQYLQQLQEEQEAYNQMSELEDICFGILSDLKKMRIEEQSIKDKNEIDKIDWNGKTESFQKLEELEVQRLKDILKRETEQTGDFAQLFEHQIRQEEQQYAQLQKQITSTLGRIQRLNEDIGNF